MREIGSAALVAAFLVAIYAVAAALIGTRGDRRWVISSRRAIYAMFGLLVLTALTLEVSFARTDLSVALVAEHSSTTTPTLYKLTALWGSQAGSLLLWAFVLSAASSAVLFITRNKHREVVPWATAVLGGVGRLLPRPDGRRDRLPLRRQLALRRLEPDPRPRAPGLPRCSSTRRWRSTHRCSTRATSSSRSPSPSRSAR